MLPTSLRNRVARAHLITDANGAQTNLLLSPAIADSARLIVHDIYVTLDADTTAPTAVTIGFGVLTPPAPTLAGVSGVVLYLPDLSPLIPWRGVAPMIGGPGEELRMSCEDPVGGNIGVNLVYEIVPA